MTCCFFGHRDTPISIKKDLRRLLIFLIEEKKADRFLVGNNGNFDRMVISTLADLKNQYSHLQCYVILQTLPKEGAPALPIETIFPHGLENVPPRYAIDKRNRWMVAHSDAVICYLSRSYGGAAKYCDLAKKQQKQVCNLFSLLSSQKSR